jgi:hypothetical protein
MQEAVSCPASSASLILKEPLQTLSNTQAPGSFVPQCTSR